MNYLLDTNVVSEWVKPVPDRGLMEWLASVDEDCVFLSVVTLAELRRGIDRMPAGQRRKRLDEWLRNELPRRFDGRLVPIGDRVAEEWGRIVARREPTGRPMGAMDAFIAATATVHGLMLVTRNVEDFRDSSEVFNPWASRRLRE